MGDERGKSTGDGRRFYVRGERLVIDRQHGKGLSGAYLHFPKSKRIGSMGRPKTSKRGKTGGGPHRKGDPVL